MYNVVPLIFTIDACLIKLEKRRTAGTETISAVNDHQTKEFRNAEGVHVSITYS